MHSNLETTEGGKGTTTGGKAVRTTIVLPPNIDAWLDVFSVIRKEPKTTIVQHALRHYADVILNTKYDEQAQAQLRFNREQYESLQKFAKELVAESA